MGMIYVIGIGQSLRGDDGAGLAAVRLWEEAHQRPGQNLDLRVELAESPGIGLLGLLEGADTAILVDAVQSGAKPGTLHKLSEGELGAFLDGADSAHGWGVAETLALGRQIDPDAMPKMIVIIGIEARQVRVGGGLSPGVATALPDAARLISETLEELPVSLGG